MLGNQREGKELNKSEKKQKTYNRQQEFLLTFFVGDKYQEKEINGFWLVKMWNGDNEKWQVAIYTQESFENYKKYGQEQAWKGIRTNDPDNFLSDLYKKYGKKR